MHRLSLFFGLLIACVWSSSHASVHEKFNTLQTQPDALYTFLKQMPKGGELHYHYDGSVYAETMLHMAKQSKNLCIHPEFFSSQFCHSNPKSLTISKIIQNSSTLKKIIHAWSMQDFVPHGESAHDHFFAVFPKVAIFYNNLKAQLLAAILKKAAEQHELYMEIIAFGLANDNYYAKLIQNEPDFARKSKILLANPAFQRDINHIVQQSETFLDDAHTALHCDTQPTQPACHIQVKFQTYTRRVKSVDAVFAQTLAGFAAAEQAPNIVGVNLLDIEDNAVAQRDYAKHMQIFSFLHQQYPKVHIALHAGELYPKKVSSHLVQSPIRDAIVVGHAERIGHGLDILEEPNPNALAGMMAAKGIAVEVNLTSNHLIFGVQGKQHPLEFYLKKHVPVVLSTDDEGILRTELTNEYFKAVSEHHIGYSSLKQINRNTLTYGFMEGASIWADPQHAVLVSDCQKLSSASCQKFIKNNTKARLQWQLEQDLLAFEQQYTKGENHHGQD